MVLADNLPAAVRFLLSLLATSNHSNAGRFGSLNEEVYEQARHDESVRDELSSVKEQRQLHVSSSV